MNNEKFKFCFIEIFTEKNVFVNPEKITTTSNAEVFQTF